MTFTISSRRYQIAFVIFMAIATHRLCTAEVFTAMSDMEELLETEAVLITNLEAYVAAHEAKLNYLKSRINEYQKEHNIASRDVTKYISNPINAYLLTKRLTSDWSILESVMTHDTGSAFLENVTQHRNIMKFPSDEDLTGAAIALIRLQKTYNLDTASIARGELNGVQYSSQMTAHDCFEMGRQSYMSEDYYHTLLWMNEAMARLNNNTDEIMKVPKADILEYLAFSVFKQGNIRSALDLTNQLLELAPNHERATGNKAYYEKQLSAGNDDKMLRGDDGSPELDQYPLDEAGVAKYTHHERENYEKLCRGEVKMDPKELAQLKCRYVTNKSPFLKIAPLKLEEAKLKPYIVIYHDVIYDREIEEIKQMAKPRFRRATVQNSKTGELEVATYRISKSAWLKDEDHEIVHTIGQRIEDMTGLTVKTAEDLQVANYGIGGHYEPHFDFARREEKEAFKSLGTGNRIATVLFYISEVAQGGATVFPSINLALWPKKGSAAFWHNLYTSGEGDYETRHAACPVLAGSKWVCNKWLHERGQEFLRPCTLQPDHPTTQ